jgi:hypothetical protein
LPNVGADVDAPIKSLDFFGELWDKRLNFDAKANYGAKPPSRPIRPIRRGRSEVDRHAVSEDDDKAVDDRRCGCGGLISILCLDG